ncbi:MAG: M48 family metallopeptidase [Candidatus Omnitrophota bacterium]
MSAENARARSKKYAAIKTKIFVADIILSVVALGAFQLLLSRPVSRFAFEAHHNFYIACFIYTAVFLGFMYVASFPLNITGSFFVEKSFALSKQSFFAWVCDEAKSVALSFVLYMACIEVFYLILRNFPTFWWAIAAGAWIFFSVVLARLMPVLLIPIFFKYSPIEDASLKEKIMALAEKSRIRLTEVCQIDFSRKTTKANAALVGLGGTRKVILADTLMNEFEQDEVVAVVAHEFGHQKYRHIWQLLAFSAVMTTAGFFVLSRVAEKVVALAGATGLTDLYIFPVLVFLMLAFGILLLPIQNYFSRVLERQADRFVFEVTGKPDAFIAVMRKLADTNLADMNPSFLKKIFMYNHPPVSERIEMGEREKSKTENI